jgi:uncharacterized protein (DUF1786 family)
MSKVGREKRWREREQENSNRSFLFEIFQSPLEIDDQGTDFFFFESLPSLSPLPFFLLRSNWLYLYGKRIQ